MYCIVNMNTFWHRFFTVIVNYVPGKNGTVVRVFHAWQSFMKRWMSGTSFCLQFYTDVNKSVLLEKIQNISSPHQLFLPIPVAYFFQIQVQIKISFIGRNACLHYCQRWMTFHGIIALHTRKLKMWSQEDDNIMNSITFRNGVHSFHCSWNGTLTEWTQPGHPG